MKTLIGLVLLLGALNAWAAQASGQVPGVVIDHIPASSGLYIGSPSLAVLPDGDYVASHDFFGPKSAEFQSARSAVFRSSNHGDTWTKISEIQGAFWSTLFVHRGALYLMGTDRHHGNAVIRRSLDGGVNWTSPTNANTGLLRDNGEYHCAPVPVMEHFGRLWRGMEWRHPPEAWGIHYRAGMFSVPVEADLLNAANWTIAQFLPSSREWNGGDMGAWLEGNAVVSPTGEVVDILRVQTQSPDEKAAIVRISPNGMTASFDPATGFIPFPGGAKKFTIRFDPQTKSYWSLATVIPARHRADNPGSIRNTLALTSSPDLTHWTIRCILLYHPDTAKHGFQYVDWLFEGDDIIAACRTAGDDDQGGAHNNHDANYLTFHRITHFRAKTMADSVPMTEAPSAVYETQELVISGTGFEVARFDNDEKAFGNRNYVWQNIPDRFAGGRFTRTKGGERAAMKVSAKRDLTLYLATTLTQQKLAVTGWTALPDVTFSYTDTGKTTMSVFTRQAKAKEEVVVPQGNWTGGLLLLPREIVEPQQKP